ncbi:MAG: zinc ribbon domain-containing protein [Bryobacteraceae bacterium]
MFCTNCGQTIDTDTRFCPSCGSPAEAPVQAPPPPPQAAAYVPPTQAASYGQPQAAPPYGQPQAAAYGQPQPAAYAQPQAAPPERKKTSPIVWILLVIGGLFVVGILAAVLVTGIVVHKAKQAGFDPELLERRPELAFVKLAVAANPDAEIVSIDEGRGIVSIRDKKTGKVVTMNFEQIRNGRISFESEGQHVSIEGRNEGGEGRMTVTTSEGTAQIGTGVVRLPAWLPAYAGATPQGFTSQSADTSSGAFAFKTSDSADRVLQFYESELKRAGFTVEVLRHAAGGMVTGVSGTRKVVVNVIADVTGTAVTCTFEDK